MSTVKQALLLGAMVLFVASCYSPQGLLKKHGIYYTTANIWYENPAEVYSTNYHRGQMIPAGSKVHVLNVGSGRVQFKHLKTGIIITFIHIPKHSRISASEFFNRYFSATNRFLNMDRFTAREKSNIYTGTIDYEMSKKAVFVAYGNPPSHRTPTLSCDRWIYWDSRARMHIITFKDDKVIGIAK